jgi:hypothetical protein
VYEEIVVRSIVAWRRCLSEPSVTWPAIGKPRTTLKLHILEGQSSSASCDLAAMGRRRECPIEQGPSYQLPLVGAPFGLSTLIGH